MVRRALRVTLIREDRTNKGSFGFFSAFATESKAASSAARCPISRLHFRTPFQFTMSVLRGRPEVSVVRPNRRE